MQQGPEKVLTLLTLAGPTDDGRNEEELNKRAGSAKTQFMNLNLEAYFRVLECHVWSIFRRGSEMWTLNKTEIKKINSFEMWCYRRMLQITWIRKKSNVWIIKTIKRKLSLIDKIGSANGAHL